MPRSPASVTFNVTPLVSTNRSVGVLTITAKHRIGRIVSLAIQIYRNMNARFCYDRFVLRASGWVIAVCCVFAAVSGGVVLVQNDFDIAEQRVVIPGSAQSLDAILALPRRSEKPHGLVIFVHGDGPADASRDSFYRPLWETFARAGYASVSWNKPGVAGAPGNWLFQSMHDRAVETEAVLAWAKGRSDIDPHRIGVWGISQAGWCCPRSPRTIPSCSS